MSNTPYLLYLSILAIIVLNLISSCPNTPVALRSSVNKAKPFFIALRESLFSTFLPLSINSPSLCLAIPNIVSNNSVLFEPTNPAIPRISPFLNSKDTSLIEG